jgi:1-acyl-sn-glycerol-3-phosphate acyltransferase
MDTTENKKPAELIITEESIDIRSIIGSKNKKLARILPGFVYAYLNKILHIKEINQSLWKHRDMLGPDFATCILDDFGVKINLINKHNIPLTGKYNLVANHPLGGLDGLALISRVGQLRPDLVSISNDILMFLPNLKMVFVPVNKHGKNVDNIKILSETFASDKLVCFFPAGLVSRKQGKEIKDLEWKTTFVSQSVRNKRDVLPVYIDGMNSKFFYNLALWRKRLRIKLNIEMLFLVDEMYKQCNKQINLIFGDPISYEVFNKSKKPYEWAQLVKQHVYNLGLGKPDVLPFYKQNEESSKSLINEENN